MRYLLITKPKAGTHLCAALLSELGLKNTHMHLNRDNYQVYEPHNLELAKRNPSSVTVNSKIQQSVGLISHGQFAYTHIYHDAEMESLFADFCKILVVRDNSEIKRSYKRWQQDSGRTAPLVSDHELDRIDQWKTVSGVFTMNFSDLVESNIEKIDQLQQHIFGRTVVDSNQSIHRALSTKTLTKSPSRE